MKVKTHIWDGIILFLIAAFLILPLALTFSILYLPSGWIFFQQDLRSAFMPESFLMELLLIHC